MGEGTAIAWATDTWNVWIGCTKVSEECAQCYADELDKKRFSKLMDGGTKGAPVRHWGPGAPRHATSEDIFNAPLRWNKKPLVCIQCGAAYEDSPAASVIKCSADPQGNGSICMGAIERRRVFTGSLMDWADAEMSDGARDKIFDQAEECQSLHFLFLTKRIEAAAKYLRRRYGRNIPEHFSIGLSWMRKFPNDVNVLLGVPARIRFLSVEPMLGPLPEIVIPEWVIFGGESGKIARPCFVEWIRDGMKYCLDKGSIPFVKQLGSNVRCSNANLFDWPDHVLLEGQGSGAAECRVRLKDPKGATMEEWPEEVRLQAMPYSYIL